MTEKTEPTPTTASTDGPTDQMEKFLQEVLPPLQQAATESYKKLSEAAQQVSEQAREVFDTSQAYARKHPLGLILGGLALGVALGMLISRK